MRAVPFVAGASAIALGSLLIASPASAATLPEGQRISVIQTLVAEVGPGASQFWDVSPANAASTQVGGPVGGVVIVEGVDVNDDGIGYAVRNDDTGEGFVPYLHTADAKTGTLGAGVEIVPVLGADIDFNVCNGIDLGSTGEILVACVQFNGESITASYIGSVTPTGAFTPIVSSGVNDVPVFDLRALATNPVTGVIYVFSNSAGYIVNRVAGTLTPVAQTEQTIHSADFDRDGQLFVIYLLDESPPQLGTLVPVTGVVTHVGSFTSGGDVLANIRAITVWGKKTLPPTGPAEILPIGLGTALLFLAGAAFVATARIRRAE